MILAWLYVAALCFALVVSLIRRSRYHWFIAALICWTVQAVNANLAPADSLPMALRLHWVRTWWRYPEIVLMVVTCLACTEAIRVTRDYAGTPFRRLQLRVAAAAISICIVGLGIYFVLPFGGNDIQRFTQMRMWLWVFLALEMAIVELLVTLERVARPTGVRNHQRLLLAVMLSHAILSPLWGATGDTWDHLRMASRGIQIACCAGWCVMMGANGSSAYGRTPR